MEKKLSLVMPLAVMLIAVGCGGGEKKTSTTTETGMAKTPTTEMQQPASTPAATTGAMNAGIKGKIAFEGTAPKGEAIKMDSDPVCKSLHKEAVYTEDVVVNPNGTLRWVMVYVKDGLGDRTFPTPTEPVVLDQVGCHYVPHVFGMMANQPIEIRNSDETLHNIHAMPTVNTAFNIGMPRAGMKQTKTFKEVEMPVHFKCDVHKWMSCYTGVFNHPFHSVSGEDGSFEIKGLPAGTYTIEAWHEKYGTQTQSVTVGDAETKEITFTFKAA
jgi:hypothetical protein